MQRKLEGGALMSSYHRDLQDIPLVFTGHVYIARAVKDITFLDDKLRITRGGDGSLFVLEKEGDTGTKWSCHFIIMVFDARLFTWNEYSGRFTVTIAAPKLFAHGISW